MAPSVLLALLAGVAFLVSCLGTLLLTGILQRREMLDVPNERSSHTVPVPRGGGIAVVGTIVIGWAGLTAAHLLGTRYLVVPAAAAGLALVSWIDDRRGLSPAPRLLAQIVAVAVTMAALPGGALFQGWLPPALDAIATALLWVWFINLFNFMDGIDGIAGSEAVAIGLGLMLVASSGRMLDLGIAFPAGVVVLAALGFLVWNWAPAKIILGDVGSIPLGFLLGFLLRNLALQGRWKAALILPLYFLADATLTLLRRLARGERVWRPHREHFYQRAVQRGLSHDAVVLRVVAADVVLIGCAWAAENGWGFGGLAIAALTVALLLGVLSRGARRA
ncbi:MAG TPA: glycosyltransferase family 4 protein [Stellaceae bacterium]|nr:glycosyltransferase family 4 protein [Stellaceae bacterium]